jgi:hypothetical protein
MSEYLSNFSSLGSKEAEELNVKQMEFYELAAGRRELFEAASAEQTTPMK